MTSPYVVLTEDLSRVQGFIAGCVEASVLMAVGSVTGKRYSVDYLTQLIGAAIAAGVADPHGTGVDGLHWALQHEGISQYQDMPADQWQAVLQQANGRYPVLLGVDQAGNGFPEDGGVNGHEVVVFAPGPQPDTWIVGDPNTQESQQGQTVTYTTAQIAAAHPTTLTAVYGQGGYISQPIGIGSPWAQVTAPGVNVTITNPLSILGDMLGFIASPTRMFKLIAGAFLIGLAALLFIFSKSAPVLTAGAQYVAPVAGQVIAADISRGRAQRAQVHEEAQAKARTQVSAGAQAAQITEGEQRQADLAESWYKPQQIEAGHVRHPTAPLGTAGQPGNLMGQPATAPTMEQQQREAEQRYQRGHGLGGSGATPRAPRAAPRASKKRNTPLLAETQLGEQTPTMGESPEQIAARQVRLGTPRQQARQANQAMRRTSQGRPAGRTPQEIEQNKNLLTRWGRRIGRRENRPGG